MTLSKSFLTLSCLTALTLTACGTKPKIEEAKYWQRNSASSALYLRGPKAQQMLHKDISTCVTEISELDKIGEVRRAIPANYNSGNEIEYRSPAQQELDEYDTPERDGYLYGEHVNYHDFETCMMGKGWERVEHLPYDEAALARKEYLERYGEKKKINKKSLSNRENVTSLHTQAQDRPPYENLNE